jgi:hypothetical protein
MRIQYGEKGMFAACILAFALLALPGIATAADKGHSGMPGMNMEGAKEGHRGMMKMGDKIFGGKVGPWQGEARLMDMKAHIEKAKASGMKMEGMKLKSHHIAIGLTDAKTKKPVTEGKGTVTVVGPDKKEEKSDFMAMEGHLGADVNLPTPGKYTFKVSVESAGRKGSATFSHSVK